MNYNKLIEKITTVCAIISGFLILVVALFSTFEAASRGFFSSPTVWTIDISRYVIIWAIFLGTSAAFVSKTHIAVDFIREALGKRFGTGLQRFLCYVGYFFALTYVSVLAWCSVDLFSEAIREAKLSYGTVLIPVAYLYLAMIIGSFLMILTLISIMLSLWKSDQYLN